MPNTIPPRASPAKAYTNAHILIVDDDESNYLILEKILSHAGLDQCTYAGTTTSAFKTIEEKPPQLILLDIMMPDMSGLDFCRKIKKVSAYRHIPIIFISALKGADIRAKAFSLGGVDYLQKPYDQNEIVARVKVHLQNGLMLRSLERQAQSTQRELELAAHFQRSLLPSEKTIKELGKAHGFHLASSFIPSGSLAGDFWQLLPIDETHFALAITDFSGHGVAAALETVRFHSLLFELKELWPTPQKLLYTLNKRMYEMLTPETFATFNYCLINSKTRNAEFYMAGAPPALHLKPKSKEGIFIGEPSTPLGVLPDWPQKMKPLSAEIKPGEGMVFYSDALSEIPYKAKDSPDPLGEEMQKQLLSLNPFTPDTLNAHLLYEFYNAPPEAREDDFTLVSVTID